MSTSTNNAFIRAYKDAAKVNSVANKTSRVDFVQRLVVTQLPEERTDVSPTQYASSATVGAVTLEEASAIETSIRPRVDGADTVMPPRPHFSVHESEGSMALSTDEDELNMETKSPRKSTPDRRRQPPSTPRRSTDGRKSTDGPTIDEIQQLPQFDEAGEQAQLAIGPQLIRVANAHTQRTAAQIASMKQRMAAQTTNDATATEHGAADSEEAFHVYETPTAPPSSDDVELAIAKFPPTTVIVEEHPLPKAPEEPVAMTPVEEVEVQTAEPGQQLNQFLTTSKVAGAPLTVRYRPQWEVDRFRWSNVSDRLKASSAHRMVDVIHGLTAQAKSGSRRVAITSYDRGEGRTTFAMNLARQAAESGMEVAIFDADFDNPSIARETGISFDVGWNRLEDGQIDWRSRNRIRRRPFRDLSVRAVNG